jgi:hypothetical protein
MTGKDIADVLTFRSFRPEPDDPTAAWKKRFPGLRTLFFGVGKQSVTFRATAKNGRFSTSETLRDVKDLKESLGSGAQAMQAHSDGGWSAVSLHTRYVLSLETNLSRRPGSEDLVKTNPRTVLGGRYERGKRYALTHNPETNSSILLSMDEEFIGRVENSFKETGFNLGRLCCGTYVLLKHALASVNVSKGNEKAASAFFVVLCEGAVCALVQHEDKWLELRSRTDVYEGQDFSPALELVAPFQARIAPEMPVVLVADSVYPGLADATTQAFQGHSVQDMSQPDLLWNLILQN